MISSTVTLKPSQPARLEPGRQRRAIGGARPTFGSGPVAVSDLGFFTRMVAGFFSFITQSRTHEMLTEDFVGFGGLRTAVDLRRSQIYGTQDGGDMDISVARERILREIGSIFTDNVSSGIAAALLGGWLAGGGKYKNTFSSFATQELFRDLAQNASSKESFLTNLAERIAPNRPEVAQHLRDILLNSAEPAADGAGKSLTEHCADLVKRINPAQKHFDVKIGADRFALPDLLKDASEFLGAVENGTGWRENASKVINDTLRIKNRKLWCISVGFVLTAAVPYAIRWITNKLDKKDGYPGDRGLAVRNKATVKAYDGKPQASKPSFQVSGAFNAFQAPAFDRKPSLTERAFPYLTQSLRNGNPLPTLLTLAPLPFVIGIFDTVNRTFRVPFSPGFGKYLKRAYDFGKGFPFTTQQQMASMFAFLIMSRLSSARSDNEFRERLVDSGLGWAIWILGTPVIKLAVAKFMDNSEMMKKMGRNTQLLKALEEGEGKRFALRTRDEIIHFATDAEKAIAKRTLAANIWIGAVSTVITMLLLGIVEPYLAILWTKRNGASQPQGLPQTQAAPTFVQA